MTKKFPRNPPHPERLCWGCERYCPANSMACGNGSDRTLHPAELFGPDWFKEIVPRAKAQHEASKADAMAAVMADVAPTPEQTDAPTAS